MKLDKDLYLGGYNINDVADPRTPQQAATKNYIDSKMASWTRRRYYYVDSINGDDNGIGYTDDPHTSDVRPIRSLDRLAEIIPRLGCGASFNVYIKPGDYSSLELSLVDYDEIHFGGSPRIYLNPEGYNIGNRDLRSLVLLNLNGSTPSLPGLEKCRVRFSNSTITSKLRNISNIIISSVGNIINLENELPVYPGEQDICFIETQAVHINNIDVSLRVLDEVTFDGMSSDYTEICVPMGTTKVNFCDFG